ncbi:MAG: SMC-Scp complex subunit ScpB [Taibaiella sp.]|nr:SMC-Scp complex subunit ScpB [Taibaiella sp.]
MNAGQLMLDVEALIFSSNEPLTIDSLTSYVSSAYEEVIEADTVVQTLAAIVEKYSAEHYPFEVKKIGGGYQFLSKVQFHPTIAQINGDKYNKKLSATAMETLAIIAYRQPITKTEIEYIRGVSSDYAIHKLLEKELIVIAGRDEEAVGKPLLYTTSKEFFDFLGINDKDDLPQLRDLNTELLVIPTDASEAIPEPEDHSMSKLTVGDDGSLIEEETPDQ